MALIRGSVNPLSVLGMRKLNFVPGHFARFTIRDFRGDTKNLDQWINYNLNSRYAIIRRIALDQNKKMIEVVEIGIEDPRELTMLSLGCPHLHKK
jgi:hypothetical protein